MISRLLVLAVFLVGGVQAQVDPPGDEGLPGGSDGPDFSSGLVLGLGLGGIGVAAILGTLYYLGVGGLRHIDKNNVLEHPLRAALLETVESEPGVHLRELATRHETAVTNTQWHLRKLEMASLVRTQKVQGRRLYYPTRGGVEAKATALRNAAVSNPNAKAILECVTHNAGINQKSLADTLDMNPGTVRWHLRKMEGAGILHVVHEGTSARYFAATPARRPGARPKRARDEESVVVKE